MIKKIICFTLYILSMCSFVGSFFVENVAIKYALFITSLLFVFCFFATLHELIHIIVCKILGGKVLGFSIYPLSYVDNNITIGKFCYFVNYEINSEQGKKIVLLSAFILDFIIFIVFSLLNIYTINMYFIAISVFELCEMILSCISKNGDLYKIIRGK